MIGESTEKIENTRTEVIIVRDVMITFVITSISTFIANPPFDITLIQWAENLYVPILAAALMAFVSYANAMGVKRR